MRHDIRAALAVALLLAATGRHGLAQQPVAAELSGLVRDLACAPSAPAVKPSATIQVVSGREPSKTLFGNGDAVVVNAGTAQGVGNGSEYYARRVVGDNFTEAVPGGTKPISVHTAGMIRIVEAQTDVSIAVVTYGCDGVLKGDYLEPFQTPALPPDTAPGTPDYTQPGHLILADDRRQIAGGGDFMVLDRGSDHGIHAGQRVTIFRKTMPRDDAPVSTIGTATVFVVHPGRSLVRVEQSTEAVYVGDLVAIHR